jgi:hypothetical protein
MKTTLAAFFIFAASVRCCLGQTDTNLLAMGDWSAPVTDQVWTLRGRLLIYAPLPEPADEKKAGLWNAARVYLELQLVDPNIFTFGDPTEIYIDRYLPMHCEMRDGHDNLIPGQEAWRILEGPQPPQFAVVLSTDSTVRLRASTGVCAQRPGVLKIAVPERAWALPKTDTNEYFLSATFSPSTNHPGALDHHLWQGTLHLPKVKIPLNQVK